MGYHEKNSPKKFEEGKARTSIYLDYIHKNETLLKESIKKLEIILD